MGNRSRSNWRAIFGKSQLKRQIFEVKVENLTNTAVGIVPKDPYAKLTSFDDETISVHKFCCSFQKRVYFMYISMYHKYIRVHAFMCESFRISDTFI